MSTHRDLFDDVGKPPIDAQCRHMHTCACSACFTYLDKLRKNLVPCNCALCRVVRGGQVEYRCVCEDDPVFFLGTGVGAEKDATKELKWCEEIKGPLLDARTWEARTLGTRDDCKRVLLTDFVTMEAKRKIKAHVLRRSLGALIQARHQAAPDLRKPTVPVFSAPHVLTATVVGSHTDGRLLVELDAVNWQPKKTAVFDPAFSDTPPPKVCAELAGVGRGTGRTPRWDGKGPNEKRRDRQVVECFVEEASGKLQCYLHSMGQGCTIEVRL